MIGKIVSESYYFIVILYIERGCKLNDKEIKNIFIWCVFIGCLIFKYIKNWFFWLDVDFEVGFY